MRCIRLKNIKKIFSNESVFHLCFAFTRVGRSIFLRRVKIVPSKSIEGNSFITNLNFSYKVWSVTPRSEYQGNLLKQWEDNESIDFWENISRKGNPTRIMAAPNAQVQFQEFLKENDIEYELIIENAERFFSINYPMMERYSFSHI